jgi:hypothetical protein
MNVVVEMYGALNIYQVWHVESVKVDAGLGCKRDGLPNKPAAEAETSANDNAQLLLGKISAQQQSAEAPYWASRRPVLVELNLNRIQGITLSYKLKVWYFQSPGTLPAAVL